MNRHGPDRRPDRGPARGPNRRDDAPARAGRPPSHPRSGGRTGRSAPSGARPATLPSNVLVIHEDAWLIVVDKPAGLPVRSRGKGAALDRIVEAYLRLTREDALAMGVHEIDKEASGLVVFAKHPRAAAALREELAPMRAGRSYTALVDPPAEGEPLPEATTFQSVLAVSPRGVPESVTPKSGPARRRPAVTHARFVRAGAGGMLVRLRLETDVPCQARVHLAESGRPVLGDRAYSSTRHDVGRVCVHLSELVFRHPGSGETIRMRAPLPAEFDRIIDALPGEYAPETPASEITDAEGRPAGETSWEHVAGWYDQLLAGRGSDHHKDTILPGVIRLLELRPGERVLDIACGQGALARALGESGVDADYVGVDASESLIEAANRAARAHDRFVVGDARDLARAGIEGGSFDGAACVLALMNIDQLGRAAQSAADALRPGGRLVGVVLHPAFRAPGRTHWGWVARESGERLQFRRADAYLSEDRFEVVMNPGEVAKGGRPITTTTFLRPIGAYVQALTDAGLAVDAFEEWTSARRSEPGPNAEEEDRARREFPMFLAIRARKAGAP